MKLFKSLFSKHKKVNIEFCEKNLDRFLTEDNFSDYQTFFNQESIHYKEYECQSMCQECKRTPYAIVDGKFVSAANSAELLDKMKSISNE